MVLSRPQTADAASLAGEGPELDRSARRRVARRGLLALPVVALALAIPAAPAVAQTSNGTSGYGQKAPPPTTTPKSGTAPSKEATTPTESTTPKEAPAPKASEEPTTTTPKTAVSPSTSKLPFTGLDLRWIVGAGILLLGAGISIRLVQRRGARL
jgi:hypothetical protein